MEEFRITDGTTTVDFVADSDYGLLGWPLKIAPFRRSRLASRSPYAEVQEQLTIFITGTSPQDSQQNLGRLIKLMSQSQRFASNDLSVNPVRLVYEPNASSGDTWECLILGNDNQPMVTLPSDYARSGVTQVADGVSLTFLREGVWVKTTEESVSFTDLTAEGVTPVTFSSEPDAYSPLWVNFSLAGNNKTHKGYCIFADSAGADINGTATNVTASTTAWQSGGVGPSASSSAGDVLRAFIKVRNNSSTVSWKIAIADATGSIKSSVEVVPAGSTGWQIIAFPPITLIGGIGFGAVRVQADQVDGTQSIDVKDGILAAGDANVFYFEFTSEYLLLQNTGVTIDHRILDAPAPIVTESGGFAVSGGGSVAFYSNKSSGYLGLIGLTGSASTLDMTDVGTASQSVNRYIGSLLPT